MLMAMLLVSRLEAWKVNYELQLLSSGWSGPICNRSSLAVLFSFKTTLLVYRRCIGIPGIQSRVLR